MGLITKYENQTIFDLLLQNAGAISGLFEFLESNDLTLLDIPEGSYIAPDVLNQKVVDYFTAKNGEVSIVSAGSVAHGAPVVLTLNGLPFNEYLVGEENDISLIDQDGELITPMEVVDNTIKVNVGGTGDVWMRNPDWLPIPIVDGSEEVIYTLVAVFADGDNKVSSRIGGSNTDIDWGDGTTQVVGSSTIVEHFYDFDTLPVSTELTMENGRVYRQALIKWTPQTSWTGFWIFREAQSFRHQYLDIVAHVPNISTITNNQGYCPYLERFSLPVSTPNVAMNNLFYYCFNLQEIRIDWSQVQQVGQMSNIKVRDLGDMNLSSCLTNTPSMTRTFDVKRIGELRLYASNVGALSLNGIKEIGTIYIYNDTDIYGFLMENHALEGEIRIIAPNVKYAQLLTRNANKYKKLFLDAPLVENINQLCYVASSVEEVELTDASNVTITTNSFIYAYGLSKLKLPGIKVAFSVVGTNIDSNNMENLFNDLADLTGQTSQTISITSTPAVGALTPAQLAIATNKNWTIIQ